MLASTRDHLLTMAKGKTYFGHQSVGANVLEGLRTRHPRARLAHVTLPLTVTQRGIKGSMRALLSA